MLSKVQCHSTRTLADLEFHQLAMIKNQSRLHQLKLMLSCALSERNSHIEEGYDLVSHLPHQKKLENVKAAHWETILHNGTTFPTLYIQHYD